MRSRQQGEVARSQRGRARLAVDLQQAAEECPPTAASAATGAALLDKYVAAVNAHDTSSFPELFTESYIQHSGRSPSGLAAQVENFRGIFATMPDIRMRVEDRIIAGDKVVARNTLSATRTRAIRGIEATARRAVRSSRLGA